MKASDLIALKLSKYTDFVFSGQGGSVVHICDSIYKRKDIKFYLDFLLVFTKNHIFKKKLAQFL